MVRTELTRDSMISRRFSGVCRQLTLRPDEIHHGFGAIQKLNPFAEMFAVPLHFLDAIVPLARRARQHDDFIIALEQFLGQRPAQEAAAARQHNAFFIISMNVHSKFSFGAFAAGERIAFKMRPFQILKPFSNQATTRHSNPIAHVRADTFPDWPAQA